LLINFNVPMLRNGIYRKFNSFFEKAQNSLWNSFLLW
jgi:hypothetical protein